MSSLHAGPDQPAGRARRTQGVATSRRMPSWARLRASASRACGAAVLVGATVAVFSQEAMASGSVGPSSPRATPSGQSDPQSRAAALAKEAARQGERLKALEAFHRSSEGEESRRASAQRYRRLGPAAARDAARKHHRVFELAPFAPLKKPGLRVESILGDFTARVHGTTEGDEGKLAIIDSTIPLATKGADGDRRAVDLSFAAAPGGFSPRVPLTELVVAEEAGEGATVGAADLGVAPVVSDPSASAQTDASAVFYANVAADTDFAIRALPGGLQTLHHIRSPEAPEIFDLELRLPDGATIRRDGDRYLVERDGAMLYAITLPVAWDADGRPVPVEAELAGTRLRMTARHRSGDWMYPLVLDPSVMDLHHYWNGEQSHQGWGYYCMAQCGMFRPGFDPSYNRVLFLDIAADVWPNQWGRAEWSYSTPGPTAKIWYAEFQDVGSDQGALNGQSCHFTGIVNRNAGGWETRVGDGAALNWTICNSFWHHSPGFCVAPVSGGCIDHGGSENNYAVFGAHVSNAGYRGHFTANWIHGSTIGLSDWTKPAVTGGMPFAINPSTNLYPRVEDSGVGVGHMRISNLDDANWQREWHPTCQGTTRWRCPPVLEEHVNVGDLLRPGRSRIRVQVWDKVNNTSYRDYDVINYSTSWKYGGTDRSVNTSSEYRAVEVAASNSSEEWMVSVLDGLTPEDSDRFSNYIHSLTYDPEAQASSDGSTSGGVTATASHTAAIECTWEGDKYYPNGTQRRPIPPYLVDNRGRVNGRGSFHCNTTDPAFKVGFKTCLQKISATNPGTIRFIDIDCDPRMFYAYETVGGQTVTAGRDCTGGNARRRYRVNARLSIFSAHTGERLKTNRRSSREETLECRAG